MHERSHVPSSMKTVLIVEDEFGLAEGLLSVLTEEGYRPMLARDGRQGLDRLRKERPDLLLVDFMMPVMNGAEMIREIRKESEHRDLPIILMSAAHEPILRRYYDGYNAYLKKPFETFTLLTLLRQFLPNPS
jgi:CheY-like chemotaxis protein